MALLGSGRQGNIPFPLMIVMLPSSTRRDGIKQWFGCGRQPIKWRGEGSKEEFYRRAGASENRLRALKKRCRDYACGLLHFHAHSTHLSGLHTPISFSSSRTATHTQPWRPALHTSKFLPTHFLLSFSPTPRTQPHCHKKCDPACFPSALTSCSLLPCHWYVPSVQGGPAWRTPGFLRLLSSPVERKAAFLECNSLDLSTSMAVGQASSEIWGIIISKNIIFPMFFFFRNQYRVGAVLSLGARIKFFYMSLVNKKSVQASESKESPGPLLSSPQWIISTFHASSAKAVQVLPHTIVQYCLLKDSSEPAGLTL